MTTSHLAIDDNVLIKVYSQFSELRRSLGQKFCGVDHESFVDGGRFQGIAMPAAMLASEHLLAVANIINRFCYSLHSLVAWEQTLIMLTADEKSIVLFEFVVDVASNCLSLPYSIRQMLGNYQVDVAG